MQRFLYRSKDIEGVDRDALQREILDVVTAEGVLGLICRGECTPAALADSTD